MSQKSSSGLPPKGSKTYEEYSLFDQPSGPIHDKVRLLTSKVGLSLDHLMILEVSVTMAILH
jgi:hypothetical protein